jgi:hypothetical protein
MVGRTGERLVTSADSGGAPEYDCYRSDDLDAVIEYLHCTLNCDL